MIEPWHGYATCPVCGSTDISEDTVEDPDILVVSCSGCGQTLMDEYVGKD
jgi:transcription elongation factor Elf1